MPWFQQEIKKPYWQKLEQYYSKCNDTIYPPKQDIFNAFTIEPKDIKVVIVGQDPYINEGEAHGFCFSIKSGKLPPSLRNILKVIERDIGKPSSVTNGNLTSWAHQGVFLLNTHLTVSSGESLGHAAWGWETFTNSALQHLRTYPHIVYLLWGKHASAKQIFIDNENNLVLITGHPSPLAIKGGFLQCSHFSIANTYLESKGLKPIQW